jgi:hypothetical protein
MTTTYPIGARRWWRPLRIARARWRLFLATLVGLLIFALVPSDWRLINGMLIGWDVGVVVYLVLAVELALRTDTDHIRKRSDLYDEGRVAIPVLTGTAALASIGAIRPINHGTRRPPLSKPLICGGDHPAVMDLHPAYLRVSLCARVLCGASGASKRAWLSR